MWWQVLVIPALTGKVEAGGPLELSGQSAWLNYPAPGLSERHCLKKQGGQLLRLKVLAESFLALPPLLLFQGTLSTLVTGKGNNHYLVLLLQATFKVFVLFSSFSRF